MPSTEQGVTLQTDTMSAVPGGPVRTLAATVMMNGVPVQVQMQVVAIADSNGVVLDSPYDPRGLLNDIANTLKDIRVMVARLADLPFVDNQEQRFDSAGVQSP